jgi:hypothetical protein
MKEAKKMVDVAYHITAMCVPSVSEAHNVMEQKV